MFGSLGMPELIVILVIALIIFGPRKLPELGRSLGRTLAEFKKTSNDLRTSLEEDVRIDEQQSAQAASATATTSSPQSQAAAPPPKTDTADQ